MATATLPKSQKSPLNKLRLAGYACVALLALAILWLAMHFSSIKGQAQIGVGYGAHIVCSCHYIAGRDLKSCLSDFEPGMGMVNISDDPAHKRITASVMLLASATVERRGTFGCIQLNDAELKSGN